MRSVQVVRYIRMAGSIIDRRIKINYFFGNTRHNAQVPGTSDLLGMWKSLPGPERIRRICRSS